ncbi:MAG: PilN domain-containing protein [Burkholderiales bacterium]|nr:PilN domain-containing protein [Burkholderiales bacterium]
MHDIDLIPADYRALRQGRRWWAWSGAAIAVALLATAGARTWLHGAIAREAPQVAALRTQDREAQALRDELLALSQQETRLRDQVQGLRALRRNPPWQTALRAVDQALDQTPAPRLWLEQLQVQAAPPSHQLALKGHAADHAALSQFVQALGLQPGLTEVRLTQSGLRQAAGVDVVDFELRATLAHEGQP